MKIAVYGDSFAEYNPQGKFPGWPERLAEKMNAEVSIFGKAGTSVLFSYRKFLENYKDYDLNIVLITDPFRYPKAIELSGNKEVYAVNYANIENHRKNYAQSQLDHKILDNLEGWFISMDETLYQLFAELATKDMASMRNNTIFYPCFTCSWGPDFYKTLGLRPDRDLFSIRDNVFKRIGVEPNNFTENNLVISNHFSPELNESFANFLLTKINTNEWDFDMLFNTELTHPASYYFNMDK